MKTYIKIKIKSLAEEAKLIHKEEHKFPGEYEVRKGLYEHRINAVRPECRAANLAYGFLRGKSYEQIERTTKSRPNWNRIQRIVEKYGAKYFGGDLNELQQAFIVWKFGH